MGEFHFKLPDIGEGVVEAEVTAWHVAIGDKVNEDDPIADVMTDKATIELTAPVSGTVIALAGEAGDTVAVGGDLIIFATEAEPRDDDPPKPDSMANIPPHKPQSQNPTPAPSQLYDYKLPDIGEGVVEAEITAWHVVIGDKVNEDDPIADAMTDKATIELTAPVSGTIANLACEAGDMLAVGATLSLIETDDPITVTDTPENAPLPAPSEIQKQETHTHKIPSAIAAPSSPSLTPAKALASPAVRKRAAHAGIDLSKAVASGPQGQVTQFDLDTLITQLNTVPEVAEGETRIKVIGLRRVIAERMQDAKRHIPHFAYVEEIDVTALEAFRARANAKKSEDQPKLTVLPFIIRAIALSLQDWPQFNAHYNDGSRPGDPDRKTGYISQFSDLNLGIATQTDNGLVVPVLRRAQTLSVWQIAAEISRLSNGARQNKLAPADFSGATTTLTSLGPMGGLVTTPVINRPEVAIFGPNKIRKTLVMDTGQITERKVMNFSISCDHRVIDGYDAAAMMQDMKAWLQDPTLMFLS